MSVFTTSCFLFLRNPRGGVEDLDRMQAAGFAGVFCNIGDHAPEEWEAIVRPRSLARGMVCGPWLRTTDSSGAFSPARLEELVGCADRWGSPLIVNSESELKGSGAALTTLIAEACGGRDAAVSMEPWPFADVEWWPLRKVPVLPQIFPGSPTPATAVEMWHAYGVRCVYPTFASFAGMTPADYLLQAPYSIYTADDCGGDYAAWSPRSQGYEGCVDDGGGGMMAGVGTVASLRTAWDELEQANTDDRWRRDNRGEAAALETYWNAPPGTAAPTTIRSHYGLALLAIAEARRYAEGSHA